MNRLIHRSWGEDFANISLDLFTNFSHSSSAFISGRERESLFARDLRARLA
jgi:hypothetical protein